MVYRKVLARITLLCVIFCCGCFDGGVAATIPASSGITKNRSLETILRIRKWMSALLIGTPPKPPSTPPQDLKVVFAGFGRSGSHSLQEALRVLGYSTCHGEDIMLGSTSRYKELTDAMIGQDVDSILQNTKDQGYNATMELHSMFWRSIRERKPDVKYIFVVRDFEGWWESIKVLYESYRPLVSYPVRALPLLGKIGDIKVSAAAEELNVTKGQARNFFRFPSSDKHKAARRQAHKNYVRDAYHYRKHNPSNTIVFEIGSGKGGFSYAALCGFLDIPSSQCPTEPFPSICERGAVRRMGYVARVVEAILYIGLFVVSAKLTFSLADLGDFTSSVVRSLKTLDTTISLWLLLAIVSLAVFLNSWAAWITMLSALADCLSAATSSKILLHEAQHGESPFRQTDSFEPRVMAKVLIPTLLLALLETKSRITGIDDRSLVAELSAISLVASHTPGEESSCRNVAAALLLCATLFVSSQPITGLALLLSVFSLDSTIHFVPAFQKMFTEGEWKVLCFMISLSLVNGTIVKTGAAEDELRCFIANVILVGCLMSICIGSVATNLPLLIRVPMIVVLWSFPLFIYLWSNTIGYDWFLRFLAEVEEPSQWAATSPLLAFLPLWSHAHWLLYSLAGFVAGGCVFMENFGQCEAHKQRSRAVVVMERKLVHILGLFSIPFTLMAPRLSPVMIAFTLSLLLIMEVLRYDFPKLNRVFQRLADPRKEGCGDGCRTIMFAHIALCLGSLLPSWIANWIDPQQDQMVAGTSQSWLPLLGILSVAIGDAVGAIAGVLYGRERVWWGKQGRTLEGSAAMFFSMLLSGIAITGEFGENAADRCIIVLVLAFMTAIEAHTTHVDNLIVPLSGASMMLLLTSAWKGGA